MKKGMKSLSEILNSALAILLAAMSILVLGNVILRYIFHSGIMWSEEMSRYLFVWMIIIGIIVAFKENLHFGVDIVTKALPKTTQKVFAIVSNIIILYILWILLKGSWEMTMLNINTTAPVTGLPLKFVYGGGMVLSISIIVLVVKNIVLILTNREDPSKSTPVTNTSVNDLEKN